MNSPAELSQSLLAVIDSRKRVEHAIQTHGLTESSLSILAIGKAAPAMMEGAFSALDGLGIAVQSALAITKVGYAPHPVEVPNQNRTEWWEGDHPLPGERSFRAGKRLLSWFDQANGPVLVLLSGGASAAVESLLPGIDEGTYTTEVQRLLMSGATIHELNAFRRSVSALKGGRVAERLGERLSSVWVVSDVLDDDLRTIGSGMFYLPETASRHHIVSSALIEVPRLAGVVRIAGYEVESVGVFSDPDHLQLQLDNRLERLKKGQAVLGMGECPVEVTGNGVGGRCTYLAHRMAPLLVDQVGVSFMALATDGTDGPTPYAGGFVDSTTYRSDPEGWMEANQNFDSATWLGRANRLVTTGPTGTNINDLYLLWRD